MKFIDEAEGEVRLGDLLEEAQHQPIVIRRFPGTVSNQHSYELRIWRRSQRRQRVRPKRRIDVDAKQVLVRSSNVADHRVRTEWSERRSASGMARA